MVYFCVAFVPKNTALPPILGVEGGGVQIKFWSNVASMQNFSFLEGVFLTVPGGVGCGVVGLLRNKTKLQPKLVEVELCLSLAKENTKISV